LRGLQKALHRLGEDLGGTMTWVVKAGVNVATDYEVPEYLHHWQAGLNGQAKDPEWVTEQSLAYRFDDRNYAAHIANKFPISAYSDDVRLVKLRRKTIAGFTDVPRTALPRLHCSAVGHSFGHGEECHYCGFTDAQRTRSAATGKDDK
jgi:hypothetical protein